MSEPLVKLKKTSNIILVISLSLWLSGAACLFGCEMAGAKSHSKSLASGSMLANHSCCKRAKGKKEVKPAGEFPNPSTNDSRCPFAKQPTEQASKSKSEIAPALSVSNNLWFSQEREKLQQLFSYHMLLPDRGGTHLQNCVFLI